MFDVIVAGAGIAGLTTAVRATERGLSVLLLEKTGAIGGSSAMSGGFFAFSDTPEQQAEGIQDSRELFREDLVTTSGGEADERLIDAYLDNERRTYAWLHDHGVEFPFIERSSGQSVGRSHLSAIKDVLRMLADRFVELGGELRFESRASRLVRGAAGRVVGIEVSGADGARIEEVRLAVVLATGGFSRGSDILRVFAPEQLGAIPYGGRANTGDGLRMAWRLGAGMADMSRVAATYGSHPNTGEDQHELLTAYYSGAIIVNRAGRRFIDESLSYKTLGAACLEQDGALGFEVFDAKVRAQSHDGVPLADIGALEARGHVLKGETLVELAAIAGIDADGLIATVERYNRAVDGLEPDEVGRKSLCNGVGALLRVDEGPYYAYPAKPLMTSTYCGVTVDPEGVVIDVDGERIEGLRAVGEVVGGFHGQAYMTGTSLGKGAVFGLVVADALVDEQVPVG